MEIIWGGEGTPQIRAAVHDFVASLTGSQRGFGLCSVMGVLDEGRLIAGVVYHNWAPEYGVIELSAAAVDKRWLTRPVLKAMFSYPFDGAGCQLCVLRVSEGNRPMHRIAKAYGFRETVIPRLRGRGEAEHIFTLSDDDWRDNRFNRRRP